MGEYAKKNRYAVMSVCGMGAFVGFGESIGCEEIGSQESGVGEGIGCDEIGSQEIGCDE